MAKKYIRLVNNDRLKKDIRLALRWWGFDPDSSDEQRIEAVIKSCLSYFLYDHVEGYDLITGDVDFHSKIGGRNDYC